MQVLENKQNLGFAAGNNLVLSHILMADACDYVFLLNPDTALPAGVLEALRDFLAGHPQYAAVGPLQVEYDGALSSDRLNRVSRRDIAIGKYHVLRRWLPEVTLHVANDHPPGVLGVYYVQGSAFFARVEALRTIRIFDEIFHSFYEEVDLCRRALWTGQKLGLLTTVRLPHASRGSGKSIAIAPLSAVPKQIPVHAYRSQHRNPVASCRIAPAGAIGFARSSPLAGEHRYELHIVGNGYSVADREYYSDSPGKKAQKQDGQIRTTPRFRRSHVAMLPGDSGLW